MEIVFGIKSKLQLEIKDIQEKIQLEGYIADYKMKENELLGKMHDIFSKEKEFWKQRSRALCLFSGDKKTRYFHMKALKHGAARKISAIDFNGSRFEKDEDIQINIVLYFNNLIKENDGINYEVQDILTEAILYLVKKEANKMLASIPSREARSKNLCFLLKVIRLWG